MPPTQSRSNRALLHHGVSAPGWKFCAALVLFLGSAGLTSLGQVPDDSGPQLNAPDSSPAAASLTPEPRQKIHRPIVADVRFVGNRHTKDVQIYNKIKTRRDSEFDPEQVEKDIRSLDATGRFRDIISHTKTTKDGVIVTFEFVERPYIQYVEYHGHKYGPGLERLAKEHGLKKGDALSPFNVREGRRKVEELYHQNGFPKADVLILEGENPNDKGVIYEIIEGPMQRVAHVNFVGHTLASASRLSTFIQSKPGYFSYATPYLSSRLDRQKLEQDVDTLKKYYRSLGYFRAEIGREIIADDDGKWVTINFIINEGPRYVIRNVEIVGSTKFEADELSRFLKLQRGAPFNQGFLEWDRNLLTDLYGTQGHAFANIQADVRLLEQPGELDVVYSITEGSVFHVGEIKVHIAGGDVTPHTKETVVLNRLNIRHGDLVDTREIRNGERRLTASGLFITNQQEGEPPRIKINEPRLDLESLVESPPRGDTVRGQSPESPARQARPLAREQRDGENRHGHGIYSWDGPRQSQPRETMVRTPRVPASPPRTPAPRSPSAPR
jgi:outer membrane protein insertion porin family